MSAQPTPSADQQASPPFGVVTDPPLIGELVAAVLSVDRRLANLEEMLEEFRPLLEWAKGRAEKAAGTRWPRFGGGQGG